MFVSHSDHGVGGVCQEGRGLCQEGSLPGGSLCQEGVCGQWSAVGMHPTVITARKRSLGQGNIFIGVCQESLFTVGGLPQCMLEADPPPKNGEPPQDWRTPPKNGDPPEWRPPQEWRIPPKNGEPPQEWRPPNHSMPGDTVNARAVRILLECNLVVAIVDFVEINLNVCDNRLLTNTYLLKPKYKTVNTN